jgi:hypothetical protein
MEQLSPQLIIHFHAIKKQKDYITCANKSHKRSYQRKAAAFLELAADGKNS